MRISKHWPGRLKKADEKAGQFSKIFKFFMLGVGLTSITIYFMRSDLVQIAPDFAFDERIPKPLIERIVESQKAIAAKNRVDDAITHWRSLKFRKGYQRLQVKTILHSITLNADGSFRVKMTHSGKPYSMTVIVSGSHWASLKKMTPTPPSKWPNTEEEAVDLVLERLAPNQIENLCNAKDSEILEMIEGLGPGFSRSLLGLYRGNLELQCSCQAIGPKDALEKIMMSARNKSRMKSQN